MNMWSQKCTYEKWQVLTSIKENVSNSISHGSAVVSCGFDTAGAQGIKQPRRIPGFRGESEEVHKYSPLPEAAREEQAVSTYKCY